MRQIREYVEAMFSTLPKTKEVVDIRLQILEHMEDKFEALREQGMSESEALGSVILEFGSIDEIKGEFGIATEPEKPWDDELDRLLRDYTAFAPKRRLAVAAAVILFILSPVLSEFVDSVMVFFLMVAVGVGLLIYFNGRKKDYRALIAERRKLTGTQTRGGMEQ